MLVRGFAPEDKEAVLELYRGMGMDYSEPDLDSPLFIVKKVVEQDGKVIAACALRLTAECYLIMGNVSPQEKMESMLMMQPEVLMAAWSQGLDEIEARIPTEMEKRFQKRLKQLGWSRNRDGWHPWTRFTGA